MRSAGLLLLLLFVRSDYAETPSAQSMFDYNSKNIPKTALDVPQVDSDAMDEYLKCKADELKQYRTTCTNGGCDKNAAACATANSVAGCIAHVSCDPSKKRQFSNKQKITPQTKSGPAAPANASRSAIGGISSAATAQSDGATAGSSAANDTATTTNNSGATNSDEQDALRECKRLASAAESACSDSSDSSDDSYSSSIKEGLTAACKDLQDAGLSSAKSSAKKGAACSDAYMSCSQTCSESAETYNESDNWSTFNSTHRKCLALESRARAINESSKASNSAAKSGTNCFSDSSESPQSASGGSNSAASGSNASTAGGSGLNGTETQNQAAQAATAATAEGGLGNASATKSSKYLDVGDTSSSDMSNPFGSAPYPTSSSAAPKVTPISNNSGGSIPGGGGSPKGGGANTSGGLFAALKSTLTDIQKGFLGGGGSTAPTTDSNGNPEPTLDEHGNPMTPQQVTERKRLAAQKVTADLKSYLPGGPNYPGRRGPASDEINGKGADLFEKIHNRYILKCKLGELYDCQMP